MFQTVKQLWRGLKLTAVCLLVLLLPALGWWLGAPLSTQARPLWEYEVNNSAQCADFVADEHSTYLLVNAEQLHDMGQRHQYIQGIDYQTGELLFSKVLPFRETFSRTTLIPGTTLAYCLKWNVPTRQCVVFDWMQECQVCEMNDFGGVISLGQAAVVGHCLGMVIDRGETSQLILCQLNSDSSQVEHKTVQIEHSDLSVCDQLQLSPDGKAVILLHYSMNQTNTQFVRKMKIYDIATGALMQQIAKEIECVRWHPDDGTFLALEKDTPADGYHWQRYSNQGGQFAATGSPMAARGDAELSHSISPYVMLYSGTDSTQLRNYLRNKMGNWVMSFIEAWLPETITINVYRADSGKWVSSHTLPATAINSAMNRGAFPTPDGSSIIFHHDNKLKCWKLDSVSHWLAWVCLVIGALFSLLLIRRIVWHRKASRPLNGLPSS